MNVYECDVYDAFGIKKSITINCESVAHARRQLISAGYSVVSINQIKISEDRSIFSSSRLKLDELEFFSAQLSLLLKNGLKLDDALELTQKVAVQKKVKFVLNRLLSTVRDGNPLSSALKSEWGFDRLYVNLIKIGETSGDIASVFHSLSEDLKFKKQLNSKIKQALSYPSLILFFCISAILFVFNIVIPRMSVLFESQPSLPWYTVAMLDVADFIVKYQVLALPFIFALIFLFVRLKSLPRIKLKIDRLILFVPVVSTLVKSINRIIYTSSLHLTLKNGISVERAMQFSNEVVPNEIIRQQLVSAESRVRQGVSLSEAFQSSIVFDNIHTGLITVGEKSGDLESIFKEIKEREQDKFNATVTKFTGLLEPVLILTMAAIVGTVVVVLLMSIIAVQDVGF